MKVAIMQPYFLPYIGYWQLINYVDKFIIYDNIEYTKKGWINRNRLLLNSQPYTFTIPLKKDSDYLTISDREIAQSFNRKSFLSKVKNCYSKSPNFVEVNPVIKKIINSNSSNLFMFILESIRQICNYIDIDFSKIIISSKIPINHDLKSEKKIISICKEIGGTEYINPIGGQKLYSESNFKKENIKLRFLESNKITYKQFDNEFIPFLSILDHLMFNDIDEIKKQVKNFNLK